MHGCSSLNAKREGTGQDRKGKDEMRGEGRGREERSKL